MGKFRRKISKFLVAVLTASFLVQPGMVICASGIQKIAESTENQSDVSDEIQLTDPENSTSVKEEISVQEISKESEPSQEDLPDWEELSIQEDSIEEETTSEGGKVLE